MDATERLNDQTTTFWDGCDWSCVWCVVRVDGVGVAWGWRGMCVCVCVLVRWVRVVVVVVVRRAREARGREDLAARAIRARFVTLYACVRLVCASCGVVCGGVVCALRRCVV